MANTRLLVKVRGDGQAFAATARTAFGAAGIEVEPILSVPAPAGPPGAAAGPAQGSTWLRVGTAMAEENPWDAAHRLVAPGSAFAAAGAAEIEAVEPDVVQAWLPVPPDADHGAGVAAAADRCVFSDQDGSGGKARGPGLAWSQGDAFSELSKARDHFGA